MAVVTPIGTDVTASLTTDIWTVVAITGGGMDAAIRGTIDAGGGTLEAVWECGG